MLQIKASKEDLNKAERFGMKKPRHPAGVFRIGSLGIAPAVPYSPCAYLCSSSYLEHPALYAPIIENLRGEA